MPSTYLEWMDENLEMRRLVIVDRVFIGRICRGIDDTRRIIVKHPAVSRDHAEINMSGSQPQIRDLSKNGTWARLEFTLTLHTYTGKTAALTR